MPELDKHEKEVFIQVLEDLIIMLKGKPPVKAVESKYRLRIPDGCGDFGFYNECFTHYPNDPQVLRRDIFTSEQLKEAPMLEEIDGKWYLKLRLETYQE